MVRIGKPLREGEIVVPREFPSPKEDPGRPSREPTREPAKEPATPRRRREKTPA
jgi:hypothetical protein